MASAVAAAQAVLRAAPRLAGVPIASKAPKPLVRRFIRVTRSGGPRGRHLDTPRILVECYASTATDTGDGPRAELDAMAAVDALMNAASGGPWAGGWVTGWDGNNLADYDHPDFPSHSRWQFTGTLYLLT